MALPPESSGSRADALEDIRLLARTHGLTLEDIRVALEAQPLPPEQKSASILTRLFSYLGGAFIFAGLGLLISLVWDDIGGLQRVLITLGSGLVAFVLGMSASRDPRFERAATPLFLMAALLQPAGMFVFLDEYVPPTGNPLMASMAVFLIMTLQQAAAFVALQRTSLLFFSLVFFYATLFLLFEIIEIPRDLVAFVTGISMLCLASWVDRSPHRILSPVGYFFGTGLLLSGAYALLEFMPMALYLGVNVFMIYLSLHLRSRMVLLVSIVALLAYLSWYAHVYFAGAVGWPIALIVLGFIFLGVGALAVRLSRRIAGRVAT